jgi:hypothetical protein
MANKIKVADKFDGVKALLMGEPTEFTVEQAVAFIDERKAMHAKKSNGERKPTPQQVENEQTKEKILDVLRNAELPMAVADIMESVGMDSNQRMTALLTQLRNADKVVRTEVKGKAYYAIVHAED